MVENQAISLAWLSTAAQNDFESTGLRLMAYENLTPPLG
jgi:hypothetical protein